MQTIKCGSRLVKTIYITVSPLQKWKKSFHQKWYSQSAKKRRPWHSFHNHHCNNASWQMMVHKIGHVRFLEALFLSSKQKRVMNGKIANSLWIVLNIYFLHVHWLFCWKNEVFFVRLLAHYVRVIWYRLRVL